VKEPQFVFFMYPLLMLRRYPAAANAF